MTTATLTEPVNRATLPPGVSPSSVPTLSAVEIEVLKHLRSLRYGQLTVQIHDARVVQIERTEKIRPDPRQA